MTDKSLLLPTVILSTSLIVAGGLYLYGSDRLPFFPRSTTDDSSGSQLQPGEFSTEVYEEDLQNYDVTETKAIFAVERINEDGTFLLRYAFPLSRRNTTIISRVECPLSDTSIIEFDTRTDEVNVRPATQPIREIIDITKDTLQGVCGDDLCTTLVRECEVIRKVF